MKAKNDFLHTLPMLLLSILSIFIFFLLILNGTAISPFFFLFIAVYCIAMDYMMGASHSRPISEDEESEQSTENLRLLY